jgi:GTPase
MSEPLDPEVEYGNIEYKRKLHELTRFRKHKLSTQMNWRMHESWKKTGNKLAIYMLGIDDDGTVSNEPKESLDFSYNELKSIAEMLGAKILSRDKIITEKGMYYRIEVGIIPKTFDINETRLLVLGDSGSGKTTLIGSLTSDEKDNGEGLLRRSVLKHKHEKITGMTTNLVFEPVGYSCFKRVDVCWDDSMVKSCDHIVTLIDSPGDIKFKKTEWFGILATNPDYVILTLDITEPLTKSQFSNVIFRYKLCNSLKIPLILVINKIDQMPEKYLFKYLKRLAALLPDNQLVTIMDEEDLNLSFSSRTIPIIPVSNTTREYLEYLERLLLMLPRKSYDETTFPEFIVIETFLLPDIGIILHGTIKSGNICVGDKLLLGPFGTSDECHFVNIHIESIHRHQESTSSLNAGEIGTLLIKTDKFEESCKLKKNIVVIHPALEEKVRTILIVKIEKKYITKKAIKIGATPYISFGNMCANGKIVKKEKGELTIVLTKPVYFNYKTGMTFGLFALNKIESICLIA